jgi:hypothetical protein
MIRRTGKPNMIPCSCYKKNKKTCVAPCDKKYTYYTEYIRQGRTYDIRDINRMPEVSE